MYNSNIKISVDNIVITIIFLLPFLRYYNAPIVEVGFESLLTIVLFAACFLLCIAKPQFAIPKSLAQSRNWFILFVIWTISVTIYYELFTDINLNSPIANYNMSALITPLIIAMVIFFILCGYVNTAKAINIYSAFVTLVIAIYFFQWLLTLAGITIDFKLPFSYTSSWDYMNGKVMGMNAYPTSMFSEKSHFCEYLIPYVALCLFSDKLIQKSRIKKSIFCSLVIASSVSGNGIVLLFIVWFMYFIFFAKFKNPGHKIIVAIWGIILLVSAYFVLLKIPRFNEMFNELFVDNSGAQFENSKADYRIYRGLDIFSKMPLWGKTIGAGYKHMYLFSKKYTIISEFDFSWKTYEYFSAITMVLLYSGFIGAFACLKHFAALFRSKVAVVRGLIIIMLALWFSTEMLFNITHIMYITLIVTALYRETQLQSGAHLAGNNNE